MQKKKRRLDSSINAGSTADIAFLLLIFFLVTTTIMTDKGIMVKLPPLTDAPAPPIPERNVINIKLNAEGLMLFEKKPLPIDDLKSQVKTYILNKEHLPDRPSSPARAVVSLQNDRGTPYDDYLKVYDQLKAAYSELWESYAQTKYQSSFETLAFQQQKEIKNIIPQVISEADPTDHVQK